MIKGLKVAMILWSAIGILAALEYIFVPQQMLAGLEKGPAYLPYFLMLIGNAWIGCSVFVIIAARDPMKHIMWVQAAIVWSLLDLITAAYCIIRGIVPFSQAGIVLIINIIFIVAFLILYPWRKALVGKTIK